MPGRKLFPAVLIGACALLVVAGASTASAAVPKAKAKVSTESRPFVLPPGGTGNGLGTTEAPCPGNRTLIGGGSLFDPSLPLNSNIELSSSGPVGNAWETIYDNNINGATQPVFSEALCLKNKLKVKGGDGGRVRPRVKQVTEPLSLPGDGVATGVVAHNVECPSGYTVTSGGARFIGSTPGTGANEVTIFESGPEGNGWHVRIDNDSSEGGNAEVSALCLKNKSKVKKGEDGKARAKVKHIDEALVLPADAGTELGVVQIDVPCPAGTKLVGGGAKYPAGAPLDETTTDIELFESGPRGNSWHARYNNNNAVASTVVVSASCLNKNLKVK